MANELDRDDLTAKIPDWIAQFEAQINRDLTHRELQTEGTLTISAGDGSVSLPTDYNAAIAVALETTTAVMLEPVTIYELRQQYPTSTQGQPVKYAILGDSMHFRPYSDGGATSITIYYYTVVPPLASNDPNWLLTQYPDIYLYGSLMGSATYLHDDSRLQTWMGLYDRGIASLEGQDARAKWNGAPARAQLDVVIVP
jgi:hypothetical protein